jgi:hypothetical protein
MDDLDGFFESIYVDLEVVENILSSKMGVAEKIREIE